MIQPARRVTRLIAAMTVLIAALTVASGAQAGTFYLNTCGYSGSPAPFGAVQGSGVSAASACGNGRLGYEISSPGGVPNYAGASWSTTAPAGITITHVYTQNDLSKNIQGAGYYTSFNWDGGTTGQLPNSFGAGAGATGCCVQNFSSQHLSWAMTCRYSTCSSAASMDIGSLTVSLYESQAPALGASGALWNSSGWIRGTWPIAMSASDPSGVCTSSIGLSGQLFSGPNTSPNQSNYQQCPDPSWSTSINTGASSGSSGTGAGSMTLAVGGVNAAGVPALAARTIYVDNVAPSVQLSGPAFALANAGWQYVTARAAAGPSGVAGISCSTDGGAYQYYPGSSATVRLGGPRVSPRDLCELQQRTRREREPGRLSASHVDDRHRPTHIGRHLVCQGAQSAALHRGPQAPARRCPLQIRSPPPPPGARTREGPLSDRQGQGVPGSSRASACRLLGDGLAPPPPGAGEAPPVRPLGGVPQYEPRDDQERRIRRTSQGSGMARDELAGPHGGPGGRRLYRA